MSYIQLNLEFDARYHDEVDFAIELMQAEGFNCCSVTISNAIEEKSLDDAVVEPKPGQTPLWPQCNAQLLFIAPLSLSEQSLIEHRFQALPFPLQINDWQAIEDKPWEREWLQHYQPLLIGEESSNQFWVSPQNQTLEQNNKPILWLDPGLAFGTGSHETTYLCLQWLTTQDITNKTIIDFGCGSGILALASLLLHAQFAHCVDIDPQALTATLDNAKRNNIDFDKLATTLDYQQLPQAQADIIFANILFEPLKKLAAVLHDLTAPSGSICLSGLIQSQADELIQCYQPYFTDFIVDTKNDWVRISAIKC